MLEPGQKIDRYELLCPIGDGGMAHVWAARQMGKHGFEKVIALKVIHSRFAEIAAFRTMLLDEARIVGDIHHRNVAEVLDLGEQDGLLYLVMEYVDGDSLFAMLAPQRTASEPVALRIASQLCAGIHAAHSLVDDAGQSRKVVHRDISPQNVLINLQGEVKIIDFGIAHAAERLSAETEVGTVKGKARYMAPEQARREQLGPFTDVFGIGAVLFRMLAGRAPYAAANDVLTLQALVANAPPLSKLPDTVSPKVQQILTRALAVRPSDRYASAREMQVALEAAIAAGPAIDLAAFMEASITERALERRREVARRRSARVEEIVPDDEEPQLAPLKIDPIHVPKGPAAVAKTHPMTVAMPTPAEPLKTHPMTIEVSPTAQGTFLSAPDAPRAPAAALAPTAPAAALAPTAAAAPTALTPASPLPAAPLPTTPLPTTHPEEARVAAVVPLLPGIQSNAPSEPDDPKDPSFMDVAALVARARGQGAAPPPQPSKSDSSPKEEIIADDGSVQPKYVGPATKAVTSARERMSLGVKAAAAGVALLVAFVIVLISLPRIARSRVVAAARESGIELTTIADVGIGFDGVTAKGVTARVSRTPGITATITEIHSTLSGKDVRIQGLDAKLSGDQAEIQTGLGALILDLRAHHAGTASSPHHVSIVRASATWEGILGPESKLTASDIGVEIDSRGPTNEDVRGSVARFDLTSPRISLGPWASSIETSPAATRLRVILDPPVPDGPSVLYVRGRDVGPELTVHIERSPFSNLGLRPAELGIPGDAGSEVAAKITAKAPPAGKTEVTFEVTLAGLRPQSMRGPIDVHAAGSMRGDTGRPLELERTLVNVGPFQAGVSGTVTPHDGDLGARVDAMFKLTPMPCAQLAKVEAKNLGPLAQTLQALGQQTGAVRVYGTVNASGIVKYDTSQPEEATVSWLAKETCGVSIFGM